MASWPYNTTAWRNLRAAKLQAEPMCEICQRVDRYVMADTVDHVTAIRAGGDPFPPLSGLMALCQSHHNEKTAAVDMPHRTAGARRFKGCDADGNPIDPSDGWHGGLSKDEVGRGRGPLGESRTDLVSKLERDWSV